LLPRREGLNHGADDPAGGKGVRRAAAAKGAQRKVATAKKQTGNVIDGVMQWLPFSEETLHRIVLAVILGVAAMLVWVVASMAGVPMLAQEKLAQVASGAGFEVKRVEVRGVNRMNELKIYERCWASAISRCPGSISMGCAVI
jgi:cell division protein FtsQ